ncbi:epidermal growth factor receptor substrate 15-like 1 [Exaiptasia diaphana]|uniref:Epidermal growth factor receptor substrate 15-like 1 n=1 Tax=Exaiptasia diaphana TaxID=2652724 RepID=A0A913WY62_EXADI|nr:epidermal growth factor receptor substrate 15-like 1 [Exaiptasia diaphana]KXJ20834.1 Epidermal growth factor receptor substrate 15-like 1 [Exaiptasia diaphana]
MAAGPGIPSMNQLSAGHSSVYEAYFRQADTKLTSTIAAVDAAAFLKRSNLKEGILHKIWELCDQTGTGYLDKHRFFLALRLIALAQNGKEVSLSNLSLLVPAPNLGDIPSPLVKSPMDTTSWLVKPSEKLKYDGIFENLKPVNGYLPGDKVKPVLLNSKLPLDVLGRVWDLSDIDRDGMLDADEFAVAMHLVYKALEGEIVPLSIPPRLLPPSKRTLQNPSSAPQSPSLKIPLSGTSPVSLGQSVSKDTWVVSPSEKLKFEGMFINVDKDGDGLVSGEQVKDVFMQSGLPQPVLAHIWGLCDINNSGTLNAEQFILAMYLVQQKVKGVDVPHALTPEMIPPSMRGTLTPNTEDKDSGTLSVASSLGDFTAIKELDKITKDIEELGREKMSLQQDISETEESIRQRNTEIQNLQADLEKKRLSVQELKRQKEEAQKQLDELDKEKAKFDDKLADIKQKCQEQTKIISELQLQIQGKQKSSLVQEEELGDAKTELNKLREEESKLEKEIQSSKEYLETVQKQCKSVQGEISKARSKLSTLKETNTSLQSQIAHYNSLMNNSTASSNSLMNDFSSLTDAPFDMTPTPSETDAMSVRATAGSSPVSSLSGFSVGSGRVDETVDDDFKEKEAGDDFKDGDPFKSKENIFSSTETDGSDPFHSDDPFKSDPFHYKSVSFADPFAASDPFAGEDDLFKNDPFKADSTSNGGTGLSSKTDPFGDPFQGAFPPSKTSNDNFFASDPFKPTSEDSNKTPTIQKKVSGKDPFGGDPFGSEDPFTAS